MNNTMKKYKKKSFRILYKKLINVRNVLLVNLLIILRVEYQENKRTEMVDLKADNIIHVEKP